ALHQREAPGVDQPFGLGTERGADDDDVAFRQHAVELGERIDARDAIAELAGAAVGGDYAAAEHRCTPRHLAADPAEPDNSHGLVADLAVRRAAMDPARRPGGL